jgi:hypothetical protein
MMKEEQTQVPLAKICSNTNHIKSASLVLWVLASM